MTVIDIDAIIHGERDENFVRKDFLPTEAVAIKRTVEEHEKSAAKERMRVSQGPGKTGAKLALLNKGKSRDKIAQYVGMGRTSLKKAAEVVDSGDEDLMAEMDRTGRGLPQYFQPEKSVVARPPPFPL